MGWLAMCLFYTAFQEGKASLKWMQSKFKSATCITKKSQLWGLTLQLRVRGDAGVDKSTGQLVL